MGYVVLAAMGVAYLASLTFETIDAIALYDSLDALYLMIFVMPLLPLKPPALVLSAQYQVMSLFAMATDFPLTNTTLLTTESSSSIGLALVPALVAASALVMCLMLATFDFQRHLVKSVTAWLLYTGSIQALHVAYLPAAISSVQKVTLLEWGQGVGALLVFEFLLVLTFVIPYGINMERKLVGERRDYWVLRYYGENSYGMPKKKGQIYSVTDREMMPADEENFNSSQAFLVKQHQF